MICGAWSLPRISLVEVVRKKRNQYGPGLCWMLRAAVHVVGLYRKDGLSWTNNDDNTNINSKTASTTCCCMDTLRRGFHTTKLLRAYSSLFFQLKHTWFIPGIPLVRCVVDERRLGKQQRLGHGHFYTTAQCARNINRALLRCKVNEPAGVLLFNFEHPSGKHLWLRTSKEPNRRLRAKR